jgi:hypothetical protein
VAPLRGGPPAIISTTVHASAQMSEPTRHFSSEESSSIASGGTAAQVTH